MTVFRQDREEIKIVRQAAAIADAAQTRIGESLCVGIGEMLCTTPLELTVLEV